MRQITENELHQAPEPDDATGSAITVDHNDHNDHNASQASTAADRQLLRRVAAGDRQALTDLYLRYRQPLFGYLSRLTPDYALAEDLLQETFVAIWQSAGRYQERSTVSTWLFGIARRQAHNTLRKRHLPLGDFAELATQAAPDPEPENVVLAQATAAELTAAISHLSLIHREVLALAFGQELALQEIAAVLAIPLGTVKSRLRNAKRALRLVLRAPNDGEQVGEQP